MVPSHVYREVFTLLAPHLAPNAAIIGASARVRQTTLDLAVRQTEIELEFASRDVPRPLRWSGLRVRPEKVEFWYGAEFRLHERWLYEIDRAGEWSKRMLYP